MALESLKIPNDIQVLNAERGYLTTKVYAEGTDLNIITENGKYKISNPVNHPDSSTQSTWLVEVTKMNDVYLYQYAFCLYSNLGNIGKCYYRYRGNTGWQPWKELITSDKAFHGKGYYDSDMNNLIEIGCYLCGATGGTNKPSTIGWGTVNVFWGGTGSIIQEWVHGDGVRKWYRHFNGANWGDWQQVVTVDSINEQGYLTSKKIDNFNMHYNGKYMIQHAGVLADAPVTTITGGVWGLEVINAQVGWITQTATLIWSNETGVAYRGTRYFRTYVDSGWTEWQKVATADKYSFVCTANAGFTLNSQQNYYSNNEYNFSVKITKTDGTAFTANAPYKVATFPFTLKETRVCKVMAGTGSTWFAKASAYCNSEGITVVPLEECTTIYVSGEGSFA